MNLIVLCRAELEVTYGSGEPLEHSRKPLATTDAHRLQCVPPLPAVQFAQHRREDAATGSTDRVTERDAGAVDIDPVMVGVDQTPLPVAREGLRREGLVQLDEVQVIE